MEMIEFPGKFEPICKLTHSSLQEGLTVGSVQLVPLVLYIEMISILAHCVLCVSYEVQPFNDIFIGEYPFYKKVGRVQVLILLQGVVRMPTTVLDGMRITAWDGPVTR